MKISRRNILKLAATAPFIPLIQSVVGCSPQPVHKILRAVERTIQVKGRTAKVFGLVGVDNKPGLTFNKGDVFDVTLKNELTEPTLIHWHGLTPPWRQDGVPGITQQPLDGGKEYVYNFPLERAGTNWMHAHTLQEQGLLAAPLIIRTPEDLKKDEQEVVVMLHDFSFRPPGEVFAIVQKGMDHGMMDHSKMDSGMAMQMAMDMNDFEYDAYLANDRTLDDPEVIAVEQGGRVRLRVINGGTSTAFHLDLGDLTGEVIAVDGIDIVPVKGSRFPMTMAQRLDIRITLPKENRAFPILALREGAVERTGIILAPKNAPVEKIAGASETSHAALDLGFEATLQSAEPLAARDATKKIAYTLNGSMMPYQWSMENTADKNAKELAIAKDDRVHITLTNQSGMAHPIHLHGHHFQVVGINGKPMTGAVRDTVLVPQKQSVEIAFDGNNPGLWAFHCHHLYHMMTGMMGFVRYDGIG